MKPQSKPKKKFAQRDVDFAEGGNTKMAKPQAANPQKPGGTAHAVKGRAPGPRRASGGGPTPRAVGGLSRPAKGGQTGS
jgi:hypothetical protein